MNNWQVCVCVTQSQIHLNIWCWPLSQWEVNNLHCQTRLFHRIYEGQSRIHSLPVPLDHFYINKALWKHFFFFTPFGLSSILNMLFSKSGEMLMFDLCQTFYKYDQDSLAVALMSPKTAICPLNFSVITHCFVLYNGSFLKSAEDVDWTNPSEQESVLHRTMSCKVELSDGETTHNNLYFLFCLSQRQNFTQTQ